MPRPSEPPSTASATSSSASAKFDASAIPATVHQLIDALRNAGFEAYLVGGGVRDLQRGRPVQDFDVATSGQPDEVLGLFPRAIPIGLRHGTVMIPTPTGPVDVTTFRAGPRLEDDLARRDFTVNAMAFDLRSGDLRDPYGGAEDLERGVLLAVGSANDRLREDPLRALRAVRLAAESAFRLDDELKSALPGARLGLRSVARERIRREFERILLAPAAQAALELLRETGLIDEIVEPGRADAPAVVAALPRELALRLAGWLRDTPAEATLQRLRFPRYTTEQVVRLLRIHPIEQGADPDRPASIRRLAKRAGGDNLERLFALREAEFDVADVRSPGQTTRARARLARLRRAVADAEHRGALFLQRRDLAVDGHAVMGWLGAPTGREIGEALDFLVECVLEDPACNTAAGLREKLRTWKRPG